MLQLLTLSSHISSPNRAKRAMLTIFKQDSSAIQFVANLVLHLMFRIQLLPFAKKVLFLCSSKFEVFVFSSRIHKLQKFSRLSVKALFMSVTRLRRLSAMHFSLSFVSWHDCKILLLTTYTTFGFKATFNSKT